MQAYACRFSFFVLLFVGVPKIVFAQADLSITKTDGVTTATPGGSVTYTITASNVGPDNAPGSTIADTFPASLTCTWTCVGAGGGTCTAAGAGNINDTANLPAGASVTFTASCAIATSATGTLANTATVTSGVSDPSPANNSATDSDILTAQADLAITKTDGVTSATPGGSVTYTITASNAGPSDAPDSTIADTYPASLTCTWTCAVVGSGTCTTAGAGNINDTANLPAGASVTYTASCTISESATGTLANTATVTSSVTDPTPGNNSATDTDTLNAQADLAITNTDGVTSATPGGTVTYTITASNAGPSNASGATVSDTFAASLTCDWTCVGAGGGTCTAAGSGNIGDSVNLPSGGSVTYTATCAVAASAAGALVNTATVTSSIVDPTPGNNSATDTDTLSPEADLVLTKTDGQDELAAGATTVYTIVVMNDGPADVLGATVQDILPATLADATWTCVGADGATCSASGTGDIEDVVGLPAGSSITYTLTATSVSTGEDVINTATVSASAGVTDIVLANNTATDTNTTLPTEPPVAAFDIGLDLTASATSPERGDALTYHVAVTNAGPETAPTVVLTVTLPLVVTVSEIPAGCARAGIVVTCTLEDFASGASTDLAIHTTINLPGSGSYGTDLSASAALVTADSNAGNDESTVTVTASVPVKDYGYDYVNTDNDDDGCSASGGGLLAALAAVGMLWRRRRSA